MVYDAGTLGKIYMPTLRMTEDFATWLNILRQCDSALGIREPMTYYIRRSNSLSSRFVVAMYFNYQVYRETQGFIIDNVVLLLVQELVTSVAETFAVCLSVSEVRDLDKFWFVRLKFY